MTQTSKPTVVKNCFVFKTINCPHLLHACPYTISEWDTYRGDISPHYDMNGTLQSQKYKSRNSFISILQLNALKKTVKTIKQESATTQFMGRIMHHKKLWCQVFMWIISIHSKLNSRYFFNLWVGLYSQAKFVRNYLTHTVYFVISQLIYKEHRN